MSACEKCWADADGNPDHYSIILKQRKGTPCTPEEQAGENSKYCLYCERKTVHQWTGKCMNPSCEYHNQ